MPVLKGALHTHTTCSDGELTPGELVAVYKQLGFGFLAITDHDHLIRPDYWDSLPAGDDELIVLKGVELTVFERGYVHVGQVFGDRETLHIFNHPAEYDMPKGKVLEIIRAVADKLPLDCVEVSSKGFYTPEYDMPDVPLVKVVSDDAHTRAMCGRAWIEVDCPPTKDDVIQCIRSGKARNCFLQAGR